MAIRVLGLCVAWAMISAAGCGVEGVAIPPVHTAKDPSTRHARRSPEPDEFDIPDADLLISRIKSEGLVTTNIQCRREGPGALGALSILLVTAWMIPHKKSLDACAPPGEEVETRVQWRASRGVITEIVARGKSRKLNACVERTLRPSEPLFEGYCSATVRHGHRKP